MNESKSILDGLVTNFQTLLAQVLEFLPKVLIALLVMLAGWLLAKLLRFLAVRTVSRLDQLWQHLINRQGLQHLQDRQTPARIIGGLVFWVAILLFLSIASEIVGLNVFDHWFMEVVAYLPLVIASLLILLIGYVISSLTGDVITSSASASGLTHGELLGRSVQAVILFITVIISIDQIGINVAFLSVVAGIILATLLGGFSIAFGLGARTHVSNLIASNQLQYICQIGDRVRIGDIEGSITEILVSRVLIETAQGSVAVPAKLFDEQVLTIIEKGS